MKNEGSTGTRPPGITDIVFIAVSSKFSKEIRFSMKENIVIKP